MTTGMKRTAAALAAVLYFYAAGWFLSLEANPLAWPLEGRILFATIVWPLALMVRFMPLPWEDAA